MSIVQTIETTTRTGRHAHRLTACTAVDDCSRPPTQTLAPSINVGSPGYIVAPASCDEHFVTRKGMDYAVRDEHDLPIARPTRAPRHRAEPRLHLVPDGATGVVLAEDEPCVSCDEPDGVLDEWGVGERCREAQALDAADGYDPAED